MSILILISFVIAFLGKIWYKKIGNPLTFFAVLWGIIFFLYSLKLKPYYDINALTTQVLFIQMIGFAFGCFLTNKKSRMELTPKEQVTYVPRMKVIYVLCIATIIILLMDAVEVIGYLSKGKNYYDLANEELISENEATGFLVILKIFVSFPVSYGISAITATELFSGKKRKLLFVFNIVIVALYALQHGGRHIVIIFIISYIFAYVFSSKFKKISMKMKILIVLMSVASLSFAVWLSIAREIEEIDTSLYSYFSCCVPHLNQWLTKIAQTNEYTYGFASLNGFISPFIILLRGLGIITNTPEICSQASAAISAVEEVTVIGNGVRTNAFVGLAYSFFVDGGTLGVLIGSMLFGYASMWFYNKMNRTNSPRYMAGCLFMMCTLAMSFTRFQFCQYFYAMALLHILFVVYERKKD